MMAFLVGLFLGVVLAGFTMCLMVVASDADRHTEDCRAEENRKSTDWNVRQGIIWHCGQKDTNRGASYDAN